MESERYTSTDIQREEVVPTTLSLQDSLTQAIEDRATPEERASYDKLVKVVRDVVANSSVKESDRAAMVDRIMTDLSDRLARQLERVAKISVHSTAADHVRVPTTSRRQVKASYGQPQHVYDELERERENRRD